MTAKFSALRAAQTDLLQRIADAIPNASDEPAPVREAGESLQSFRRRMDAYYARAGHIMLQLPHGTARVLNTATRLQKFARQVKASQGFGPARKRAIGRDPEAHRATRPATEAEAACYRNRTDDELRAMVARDKAEILDRMRRNWNQKIGPGNHAGTPRDRVDYAQAIELAQREMVRRGLLDATDWDKVNAEPVHDIQPEAAPMFAAADAAAPARARWDADGGTWVPVPAIDSTPPVPAADQVLPVQTPEELAAVLAPFDLDEFQRFAVANPAALVPAVLLSADGRYPCDGCEGMTDRAALVAGPAGYYCADCAPDHCPPVQAVDSTLPVPVPVPAPGWRLPHDGEFKPHWRAGAVRFASAVRTIGKNDWVRIIYADGCTDYLFCPVACRQHREDAGALAYGWWRDEERYPTYNPHDGVYAGLPRTLAKWWESDLRLGESILRAQLAEERAAIDSTPPVPANNPNDPPPQFSPARYSKNNTCVRTPSADGFATRAVRLARALRGRWSGRERGFIMSSAKAARLQHLHASGWDACSFTRKLKPPQPTRQREICGTQVPEAGQNPPGRPAIRTRYRWDAAGGDWMYVHAPW